MTIIEELKRDSTSKETILTIGVFDGVHLGHRHLMSELTKQANTTKTGQMICCHSAVNCPATAGPAAPRRQVSYRNP